MNGNADFTAIASRRRQDMGTIHRQHYCRHDLTIFTLQGRFGIIDLRHELERYYAGAPTLHSLWDFSEAKLVDITTDDVLQFTQFVKQNTTERQGGKVALVFADDIDFGLGRMYGSQHEIEETVVPHHIFRSRDAALDWLNIPPPQPSGP